MAIILGEGFNATFTRMADSRIAQNEARSGDADHEAALRDIQKTLRGDKVHITEQRAGGPMSSGAHYIVLPTHTIGDSGIELYGVCLTDDAGAAAMKAQGQIDEDTPVYDRLGSARSDAATRNSTQGHDQFSQYMKECAAQAVQPNLALQDPQQQGAQETVRLHAATPPRAYAAQAV